VPPAEEEADAGSEVSEWGFRERREREEERRVEAEALGTGEEQGPGGVSFCLFLCLFPWCEITFREGRAEGTRGACNEPPSADCGRENRAKCTPL